MPATTWSGKRFRLRPLSPTTVPRCMHSPECIATRIAGSQSRDRPAHGAFRSTDLPHSMLRTPLPPSGPRPPLRLRTSPPALRRNRPRRTTRTSPSPSSSPPPTTTLPTSPARSGRPPPHPPQRGRPPRHRRLELRPPLILSGFDGLLNAIELGPEHRGGFIGAGVAGLRRMSGRHDPGL